MGVTVSFDKRKVEQKIMIRMQRVQTVVDQQIAKDSNYYCPERSGDLKDSVYLSSVMGSGLLVWGIFYAKKVYNFAINLAKDKNPNASAKWFERAKAARLTVWSRVAQNEYNR